MKKKIHWKPYIIAGIISLLFGIGIFCLFYFAIKRSLMDGTSYAAIILLSVAAFAWISKEGFFDLLSFGFKQLGSMIFSKKPSEYNDYPGYKEMMAEKRKSSSNYFIAIAIVGVLYLIATLIIYLVTKL